MVDPVLTALGIVVEGFAQEVAGQLMRRRRDGPRDLTPKQIRRLLQGTSDDVAEALRREIADLSDHELQAAVLAVRDSFAAVSPFTPSDALAHDLRPDSLADYVRERAADVRHAAALGEDGQAAYEQMLTAACDALLAAVVALPGFAGLAQAATIVRLEDLRQTVDELVADRARGESAARAAAATFELRYLQHVERTLGRLELFGVTRGRVPQAREFDRAYVSLAVARSHGSVDDEELTGAGVEVSGSFSEHPRVLLRGGAGAGKTTLLRWLAVDAARDTREGGGVVWGGAIPFLVPLREFARRDFPVPEALPEIVANVIVAEMPRGWVAEQFAAGRALLLVDGVDELSPQRRLDAHAWLEQIVSAYHGVQVVVSARPFAIPEDWLRAAGFVTFDLLPMSPAGVQEFVNAWHDAARDDVADDPEALEWLDECREGLLHQVATRRDLRRLAGSPLLCGLLCALYRDRGMHLPRDRKGLYEAALELLLVRWDEQRGVDVGQLPPLSLEEQVVLLQRFAYSMVKNHEVVVSRADAEQRITHAMRGLRSADVRAEGVLQRTLERSGVLREPSADEVQFVHRTFRDYLAAKEVVDAGDLRFVVEQAHLDGWHDVVVNAVALARPRERDWLLRTLLDGNAAAAGDPRIRSRLHLVAAACLEHADVLDSDEVRALVEQATARLIPPASLDEADVLARAGPFVLDLLPGPSGLTTAEAAAVVRTAAMIGGAGVREKLSEFVSAGESRVIDELLRAWRRSDDPEGYAQAVLAEVDFGDRSLEVRGWHRVQCLRHLTKLTRVVCFGDFALLEPLAAVPNLRRLELVQNEMVRDLRPLAASTTLRTFRLTTGCNFLRNLAPLADTTVEDLGLHLVAADLATLRPGRLRRLSIRDPRLADGLHALPADLALRELVVDNLARTRNLRGIERWQHLESVEFHGTPTPAELSALAALPNLHTLTIHTPNSPESLTPLREALPSVQVHSG